MKRIAKLVSLNVVVAFINVLVWSPKDDFLSLTTGTPITKALSLLLLVLSFFGVTYGNYKIIAKKDKSDLADLATQAVLADKKDDDIIDTLEECAAALVEFEDTRPFFSEQIMRSLKQIKRFEVKKESLLQILKTKQKCASVLIQTALMAEEQLIGNLVKVITRITITNQLEAVDPRNSEAYKRHYSYIERILEANDSDLTKIDQLLELVSTVDDKAVSVTNSDLDSTIDMLKSLSNGGLSFRQTIEEKGETKV